MDRSSAVPALAAVFGLAFLLVLSPGAVSGAAGPPVISGVVTGPDGAPTADAVVLARRYTVGGLYVKDQPIVRTRTDARGVFRFSGVAPLTGEFDVIVSAFAPGTTAETETATRQRPVLRLRLEAEGRLPVRVVDAQGAPVAGVRLRLDAVRVPARAPLRGGEPPLRYYSYDAALSALLFPRTDARGRALLAHLPRRAEVKLLTEDPEWVQAEHPLEPYRLTLANGDGTPEKMVPVQRAASISGRLVTESGESVPGWEVVTQGSPRFVSGKTGAHGEFRLAGLEAGTYRLDFWGLANRRFAKPPQLVVKLAGGERREVNVVCPAGALVRLRVVRAEDWAPLPGCGVTFWMPGNDINDASGVTGADGWFEQRQREGKWIIQLQMPDRYTKQFEYEPSDAYKLLYEPWTARNGEVRDLGELRVHTHAKSVIRGHVYRSDGSPAAGAVVYYPVEGRMRQTLEWTPHVTTRADGSYETPPFEPTPDVQRGADEVYDVYAALGDRWTVGPFKLGVGVGKDAEVDLQLTDTPLAVLRGRVVDDVGKPVPRATLTVGDSTGLFGSASPPMPRAGADGRFELRLWPEVDYTIFAAAEKHDWAQSSRLRLVPGRNGELPPLVLPRARSVLRIRVVDERGLPKPRVAVDGQRDDPRAGVPPFRISAMEATDARGWFIRQDVLPGTYRVQVSDSMGRAEALVEAGKPATVVLKRH